MYERALIPIDDLAFAEPALRQVSHLRLREVVLLGVMESVAMAIQKRAGLVVDVSPDVARDVETAEISTIKARLREARQRLVEGGCSVPIVLEVRTGHPGEQIVQGASELGCDIVVMSTHGRTGVARVLLGSVADHVVRHVDSAAVLLLRSSAPVR